MRGRRALPLAGAGLLILLASTLGWALGLHPAGGSVARAQYQMISFFRAKVAEPGTRQVRFDWGFLADYRNDVINCDLDVDSEGIVEETIENCGRQTSTTWTYSQPGTYHAALTAWDRSGGSDRAVVTVIVPARVAK